MTGVTIEIEHLDKKKFTLATAPGEIISNNEFKVVKKLGMPFYKDPMSYGNLVVEFKVEFPKKNFFNKDKIDKITAILSPNNKPTLSGDKKDPKTCKILEDYSEADLNPSPGGGHEEEEEEHYGGRGQNVQCQQQ